jgi:hypothetical protein
MFWQLLKSRLVQGFSPHFLSFVKGTSVLANLSKSGVALSHPDTLQPVTYPGRIAAGSRFPRRAKL